ncbi:MAG: PEP-CTERM sorting domain-containing protein [Burkholderiales bacterium]
MKLKLITIAAAALFGAAPAFAATPFLVDFESSWGAGTPVDNTYSAIGVTFTNLLGISNGDGLGPLVGGDYYKNAPSPLGTAFVQLDGATNTTSYMNVAGGVAGSLTFYYSSPEAVSGAIKAYSGLDGQGTLLGSINLTATDSAYSVWQQATFSFTGEALSFDLTPTAGIAAFDNIAAVPEPETFAFMLAGLGLMGAVIRRKQKQSA